jgi:hypothetical protein
MAKFILTLIAVPFLLQLISCSVFTSRTKQRNKKDKLTLFIPNKDSLYTIKSISVINRVSINPGRFHKLDRARIDTATNDFDKIVDAVKLMGKSYKIQFSNPDSVLNDSVYKKQITNSDFSRRFNYAQMGVTDFSDKQEGLYLIVSVIKEYTNGFGWSGGPTVYLIHVVYDFFDIQNGKINKHTTISHFRSSGSEDWKPETNDTWEVFRKLYSL